MEKRYIFKLDVARQPLIPYIEFVQGDTKVNVLEIELFNNDNAIDLTGTTIWAHSNRAGADNRCAARKDYI